MSGDGHHRTRTRGERIAFLRHGADQAFARSAASREARDDLEARGKALERAADLLERDERAVPVPRGIVITTSKGERTDYARTRCQHPHNGAPCERWATHETNDGEWFCDEHAQRFFH